MHFSRIVGAVAVLLSQAIVILAGPGGHLQLVNYTPHNWKLKYKHSYHMEWKPTQLISSGDHQEQYIEWWYNWGGSGDCGAEAIYELEGTDLYFTVQARQKNGKKILIEFSDALAAQTMMKEKTIDLGFDHDGAVMFIMSGDSDEPYITSETPGNWMQQTLPTIGSKELRQISMARSHNAGMYKISTWHIGIAHNTQCQSEGIYNQLRHGVRWFDLRPIIESGKFYSSHMSRVADKYRYIGASGAPFSEMISDLNRFTAENPGELIVLELSHELDNDDRKEIKDGLKKKTWLQLYETLGQLNGLWDPEPIHTSNLVRRNMIHPGHGHGISNGTWTLPGYGNSTRNGTWTGSSYHTMTTSSCHSMTTSNIGNTINSTLANSTLEPFNFTHPISSNATYMLAPYHNSTSPHIFHQHNTTLASNTISNTTSYLSTLPSDLTTLPVTTFIQPGSGTAIIIRLPNGAPPHPDEHPAFIPESRLPYTGEWTSTDSASTLSQFQATKLREQRVESRGALFRLAWTIAPSVVHLIEVWDAGVSIVGEAFWAERKLWQDIWGMLTPGSYPNLIEVDNIHNGQVAALAMHINRVYGNDDASSSSSSSQQKRDLRWGQRTVDNSTFASVAADNGSGSGSTAGPMAIWKIGTE